MKHDCSLGKKLFLLCVLCICTASTVRAEEDLASTLFIGTQTQGLRMCGADMHPVQKLSTTTRPMLADDAVTAIFEDSMGHLWIGSQTQGIHQWERGSDRLENYTRQNSGLTDNKVRCFAEYNGGLVVGTFDGLSMLDLYTRTLYRYHIYDVNRSNFSHFSIYSVYVDKVGTLWAE